MRKIRRWLGIRSPSEVFSRGVPPELAGANERFEVVGTTFIAFAQTPKAPLRAVQRDATAEVAAEVARLNRQIAVAKRVRRVAWAVSLGGLVAFVVVRIVAWLLGAVAVATLAACNLYGPELLEDPEPKCQEAQEHFRSCNWLAYCPPDPACLTPEAECILSLTCEEIACDDPKHGMGCTPEAAACAWHVNHSPLCQSEFL